MNIKSLKIFCLFIFVMVVITNTNYLYSFVDDAYSFILEVAIKYKKKGFELREEYYKRGEIKYGEKKAIRHNALFKGNEYFFWVGFNVDSIKKDKVHIRILDRNKKDVEIEKKVYPPNNNVVGAKILVPKTGLYYIVFWIENEKSKGVVDWSLTYAQR